MDNTAFSALHRPLSMLAVLLFPALSACAGSNGLKKQVAGLETQVTTMRADQDRLEERLSALELSTGQSSRGGGAPAAERVERPRLKVIRLSPDDEGAAAEPASEPPAPSTNDSAHRPIIRGTGDRVIKVGDGDADESTNRDGAPAKPVAQLGKDAHGS
jgi:hypothetical protein